MVSVDDDAGDRGTSRRRVESKMKRGGGAEGRRCNALRIGERRASATKKMKTETKTENAEAEAETETETETTTTLVCVRTWDEKELVDAARVSAGSAWKPGGIGGGFIYG